MFVGRDMTELMMLPKSEWKESELSFYHHSMQQVVPYLNVEGQAIHRDIIKEIELRGGIKQSETELSTWYGDYI